TPASSTGSHACRSERSRSWGAPSCSQPTASLGRGRRPPRGLTLSSREQRRFAARRSQEHVGAAHRSGTRGSLARRRRGRLRACSGKPYSYAGLNSLSKAYGVSATVWATDDPVVSSGHVGGWIGVGGTGAGPGGTAEWIQVGLAAMTSDRTNRMYYEVAVPGSRPRFVQLAATVPPGEVHRQSVP